jgi:serine/threonine protein kinase
MAAVLHEAPELFNAAPEMFEGLPERPSRANTPEDKDTDDEDSVPGDDDWDWVEVSFDSQALWEYWQVPVWKDHHLVPAVLEAWPPYQWFDEAHFGPTLKDAVQHYLGLTEEEYRLTWEKFVERFKREASSAAGLSHPNVVAIFDRGEWDGTYYIAMEYLPGRTLKQIVKDQGPLHPAIAIDIVLQVLRAARFAHRRGVIHRDLKPHNVILDEEGRAKVTDFGIARAGASDMTLTGSIMGTAQYLSPEQAQGHAVSEASDLYAVGVVLYELLTGRVPFDGETAVTIALHHISSAPTPPSALNPQVRRELDEVVLTTLAKDPAARYDSAEALIGALEQVRAGLPAPVGGRAIEPVGVPAAIGLATDPEATATWPAPARLGGIHEGGNGAPTGSMLLAGPSTRLLSTSSPSL